MIRTIALRLPDTAEGPWYGRPGFKVHGKGFARLHEDGQSLVLRMSIIDRDYRMQLEPGAFYITEHYRNFPAVLVRLSQLDRARATELLDEARRFVGLTATRRGPSRRSGGGS